MAWGSTPGAGSRCPGGVLLDPGRRSPVDAAILSWFAASALVDQRAHVGDRSLAETRGRGQLDPCTGIAAAALSMDTRARPVAFVHNLAAQGPLTRQKRQWTRTGASPVLTPAWVGRYCLWKVSPSRKPKPLQFSKHARRRMRIRHITERAVRDVLSSPDTNEPNKQDRKHARTPGKRIEGRWLTVVVGHRDDQATVITVHYERK